MNFLTGGSRREGAGEEDDGEARPSESVEDKENGQSNASSRAPVAAEIPLTPEDLQRRLQVSRSDPRITEVSGIDPLYISRALMFTLHVTSTLNPHEHRWCGR